MIRFRTLDQPQVKRRLLRAVSPMKAPAFGLFSLWLSMLLALTACQEGPDIATIVTEEIILVEGKEVVVTRLVRLTVEVPITAIATEVAGAPVELDISSNLDTTVLDPQRTTDENAVDLIESLFVGLTNYNNRTNTIDPELALEWQVKDEGHTWIFKLRDDIYWVKAGSASSVSGAEDSAQPLRPVVAADVVYAIRRACDPATAAPDVFIFFIIEGCQELNARPQAAPNDLESIGAVALDEQTLQVSLIRPASYFLAITSMPLFRPLPAELVEEMGEEWMAPEAIATSGPFVLDSSSVANGRTVLRRNPYWPIPFSGNVDRVNILHLADESVALSLWQDRDLDLSPLPASEESNMLASSPAKVELVPEQTVFYLAYNFDSPAFRVPEVRRAFGAAIDRDRLVEEVYSGLGLPMRHFAPAGVVDAPPIDQVGTGYSPDYARQQLASSGFGGCRSLPAITYLVSATDRALQQAELLREMWVEELDCAIEQITIKQVQFGTLLANTRRDAGSLRPDMWDLGWASFYPDENNWVSDVLHCTESENRQNRSCSEVDAQITLAGGMTTSEERRQLYHQIEAMFFAEDGIEPLTPLYMRGHYILRHAWLGYTPALFGGEQYDTYLVDAQTRELERNQ